MTQEIARRPEGLPPKLTDEAIDALVENITQFEKFKQKALGPKDFSQFGDNQYIEKPGWVKLGMALNISFRLVGELKKVISQDEEGEYYLWHVRGQAATPHGRIIEMDGACTSRDEFFSMANGQRKPTSQIDEKDILATCETNAFNRCMAFLCGFGELSGEEMRGKQFAKRAVTFPFGEFKGKEPMSLELADLHKLLPFWEKQASDENNKFAAANRRLVTAIKEALAEKTATVGSPAAPTPSQEGTTQREMGPLTAAGETSSPQVPSVDDWRARYLGCTTFTHFEYQETALRALWGRYDKEEQVALKMIRDQRKTELLEAAKQTPHDKAKPDVKQGQLV